MAKNAKAADAAAKIKLEAQVNEFLSSTGKPAREAAVITTPQLLMSMTKEMYNKVDKSFGSFLQYANANLTIFKIDNSRKSKSSGNYMFVATEWQGVNDSNRQKGNVYLSVKQVYFMAAKCGKLVDGNGVKIEASAIPSLPNDTVMTITDMAFTPTVKIVAPNDERWDIDYKA